MDTLTIILIVIFGLAAVGSTTVAVVLARQLKQPAGQPAFDGNAMLEQAKQEAETEARRLLLEAKDEALRIRQDVEQEARNQRKEFSRLEERLLQREEGLDNKLGALEKKEAELRTYEDEVRKLRSELQAGVSRQQGELERLAGLNAEQAKELLLRKLDGELQHEKSLMVKRAETEIREMADRKAQNILSQVIQRCCVDHVVESTVSVVTLPSDEMKGRIIGREGRNIRAFEAQTGVDLIIDDTPEAVVLSSFDPVRREVARLSLEKLISDGRIHPTRIEEAIAKSRKEVETKIREAGEQAVFEAEMHGMHPEIVKLLGRLKYRTSYGQNVLAHSLECAYLAGILAAELRADVQVAKRGSLLHDLGKALTHEREGPHALIGAEVAQRYNEPKAVVHCIAAHHNDEEPETLEAVIVQIVDAISATRPGARREQVEVYLKRMHKLEEIASSFAGIERAYAIQAGREVRIVVHPDAVDDAGASLLARDVASKVEQELEYPGQVKVTVVREIRAVDFAK